MQTVGYTWMALLYVSVLVYAITQKLSLISRVCRWSWLRFLGKIAYGAYLIHSFVLIFLTGSISPGHRIYGSWPALDSWPQFGITILALLVTLGLCQLSWQYFEKPLMRIGHRAKYERDSVDRMPQMQMNLLSSKPDA
jgi:peptidoglycan/LPS O-acetylase OafA/YrhL